MGERAVVHTPLANVIAFELEILGGHGMRAQRYGAMLDMAQGGKPATPLLVGEQIILAQSVPVLMERDSFQSVGATVITKF